MKEAGGYKAVWTHKHAHTHKLMHSFTHTHTPLMKEAAGHEAGEAELITVYWWEWCTIKLSGPPLKG